jgi:hypothetical protein
MNDEQLQQAAVKQMHELIDIAYKAISMATDIADDYGLEFGFDVSYGMGGTYYSEGYIEQEGLRYREAGWASSTSDC